MNRIIMLVLLVLLSPCSASSAEKLPPFENYTCEGNFFHALVPAGWPRSLETAPYGDMTRVAGASFDGPATGEGVPASIALYWYSGEKSFTTPQSYMNARLGSPVREDTDRGFVTEEVKVAGRKGTAFRIKTFELLWRPGLTPGGGKDEKPFIYERRAPSTKVIMDEQYIVVPASKGFFVLHYRAPERLFSTYLSVFEKVTESFEPLVP